MVHQIFISYSSKDLKETEYLRQELESQNLMCWMAPRDIRPGDIYASSIIDAIESAKILLLVLTEHSNMSPQVQKEVDRAVNAKLKIMALILRKVELSKALNYYLCDSHWIDGQQGRDAAIATTVKACHAHLQTASDLPPPLPEMKAKASRKQYKWLTAVLLLSLTLLAVLGISLIKPGFFRWPGSKFSFEIRPLPADSLGTWSERIGGRFQYYHFPDSMKVRPALEHLYTHDELDKLTISELEMLREEILARNGFIFSDPTLKHHFEAQSWYIPLAGDGTPEELNNKIFREIHFLDEDNRINILHQIENRTCAQLLKEGKLTSPYVKIFPLLYFDLSAKRITPEQTDFERHAYEAAASLAKQLMIDHQIPVEYGPHNLEEIPFKNPWEWYQKQKAPYLIFFAFGQNEGDGVHIYAGPDSQSQELAVDLAKRLGETVRSAQDIFPWKVDVRGKHPALDHNDGISLLIDVNVPKDIEDFSEYEHIGEIIDSVLLDLIMAGFHHHQNS
ncbi:MAG: TIR domain-containing protein [Bdellovibrionota bacterium]